MTPLTLYDVSKRRLTLLGAFGLLSAQYVQFGSLSTFLRIFFLLCPCKRAVMWSCKINRIHHWCSVGTKNPNPRATSQWETRLAEFPTGIMDPRVGIIMFPRNINDGFIFSHIIWRSTVRYLLVTSQLMFTKAQSYAKGKLFVGQK